MANFRYVSHLKMLGELTSVFHYTEVTLEMPLVCKNVIVFEYICFK